MWTRSVASRVCLTYPPERDPYGLKIRILVAEPRTTPKGKPTGNEDTIWLFIHLPERPTDMELQRFHEAALLKVGDWFSWSGNLHTIYDNEKGGFAYVSVKTIETPYRDKVDVLVSDAKDRIA